ncbi:hypothetical protein M0R45_026243 [Rubus argutus]|uniref:DNA topoisomerase (ATP-hydrolyzing) n=1 Tax=Rubus argutus TaxID=59490 RepID=A0AAW1WWG7_RUBAR
MVLFVQTLFIQVFKKEDRSIHRPQTKSRRSRSKYTKFKFNLDLEKFGTTRLEDDVVAMIKKRVVDMAGCLGEGMTVRLNYSEVELSGTRNGRHKNVPTPTAPFKGYCRLYLESVDNELMFTTIQDSWEVCLSIREGNFEQVSFVNSIATINGGSHVTHITNQIMDHLVRVLSEKNNNANLQANDVKNCLWVFVNALIDNPKFDADDLGQTYLNEPDNFESQYKLPDQFLEKGM